MTDWVIAGRNNASSGIRVWRVQGHSLVDGQSYDALSTQVRCLALSPDRKWLLYGQTDGLVVRSFDAESGALGDNTAVAAAPSADTYAVAWTEDSERVVVSHAASGGVRLTLLAHDGSGGFTKLDDIDTGGDPHFGTLIGLSPDGKWIVVGNGASSSRFRAVEVVDAALVNRGQVTVSASGTGRAATFLFTEFREPRTVLLLHRQAAESITEMYSLDADGEFADLMGGASSAADSGHGYVHALSPNSQYIATPGNVVGVNSTTLVDGNLPLIDEAATGSGDYLRWVNSNTLLVGGQGDEVTLWTFDGETLTEVDSVTWASTISAIETTRDPVGLPPTPEEEFNATYADASGRDPLPTMLVDGPSCQRAINTYTRFWAGVGEPLVVPVYVPLGELSLIEHGQVVVVKSQRHAIGLETGRAAIVMRDRIDPRSGTCELTVMPSKQDIEE